MNTTLLVSLVFILYFPDLRSQNLKLLQTIYTYVGTIELNSEKKINNNSSSGSSIGKRVFRHYFLYAVSVREQ